MNKYNAIDLNKGESPDSPSLGVNKDILNTLIDIKEDVSDIRQKATGEKPDRDKAHGWQAIYEGISKLMTPADKEKVMPKVAAELDKSQMSGQSSGSQKQAGKVAESIQTATKIAAAVPAMAEGGATTDKAFWVGDGTGDKKAAELVLNPTEAPINILNQKQREQAGIEDPDVFHGGKQSGAADEETISSISNYTKDSSNKIESFSTKSNNEVLDSLSNILKNPNQSGVTLSQPDSPGDKPRAYADGTVGDMFKDAPQYSSGTAVMSDLLGPTLSGGKGSDPFQVIAAPLDAMATLANLIPVVGQIIAGVIEVFKDLVLGINAAVKQVNQFAEAISYVSAPIQQAQANLSVKQIEHDISMNDKYGDSLAQVYSKSGQAWLETQKILASIANPFINVLIPVLDSVNTILPSILEYTEGAKKMSVHMDYIVKILLAIAGAIPGVAIAIAREYNQATQLSENSKGTSDNPLDVLRSLNNLNNSSISKQITSPTVGI